MAKKVHTVLVDDLDHSIPADETVVFALDGVSYEIDLSAQNAEQLRDDFAKWVGHAERTGGRKSTRSGRSAGSTPRKDLSLVRAWARAAGHEVSDRGRISSEIQEAYDKAH